MTKNELQQLIFGPHFSKVSFQCIFCGESGQKSDDKNCSRCHNDTVDSIFVGTQALNLIFSGFFGKHYDYRLNWRYNAETAVQQLQAEVCQKLSRTFGDPESPHFHAFFLPDPVFAYYSKEFLRLLSEHQRKIYIKRISVEELFGIHSFDIAMPDEADLSIIVGANGIGKTTVMKLLAALLSPNDKVLANTLFSIPFKNFSFCVGDSEKDYFSLSAKSTFVLGESPESAIVSVTLTDFVGDASGKPTIKKYRLGKWFQAEGGEQPVFQPHTIMMLSGRHSAVSETIAPTDSFQAKKTKVSPDKDVAISANALINFQSPSDLHAKWAKEAQNLEVAIKSLWGSSIPVVHFIQADRYSALSSLTNEVSFWFGESSSQSTTFFDFASPVYTSIENALSSTSRKLSVYIERILEERSLIKKDLESADTFSRILKEGIVPLNGSKEALRDLAFCLARGEIPGPKTNSHTPLYGLNVNERIERLRRTLSRLTYRLKRFISIFEGMNQFNSAKKVLIRDNGTVSFLTKAGEIPFSALSSGEQNYYVMFFKAVVEAEEGCIILIDEPEVSLSMDLQEGLADLFLDSAHENQSQIIAVTHSPFVGSGHEDNFATVEYHSPLLPWQSR